VVASEDKNEKNFHYIYVMRKMMEKDKQQQWELNTLFRLNFLSLLI
jgi:hypothetical protein